MTKILARAADAEGPVASECEVTIADGVADVAEDAIERPESIRVGAFEYAVVTISELESLQQNNIGYLNTNDFTIGIAEHIADPRRAEVVLHETFHAIFRGFGFELDHELEEKLVTLLGQGMLQVMRDNPQMVAWVYSLIGMRP